MRKRTVAVFAVLAIGVSAAASSAQNAAVSPSLDQWRRDVRDTRLLAENDAPRAYEQARRLEAALPVDAAAVDRARALNLLARTEIYMALPAQAAVHARRASELAVRQNDRVGQVEADLNLALNAVNLADFDELIAAPTRALGLLEGLDRPDLLAEALLRATAMYRRMGKLEESVTVAMHGMEVARGSNNALALIYAHQALGISFEQSFHTREARDHYAQMLEQARTAHLSLEEGYALGSLGGVTSGLGDLAGGERLIRESIERYRAVGAPFAVTFGLSNLAFNLRSQHRYADALAVNNEVVSGYERHPNQIGLWFALNFRSENNQSLGNLPAARADAERAFVVAKQVGFPPYISDSARRVATVVAAMGDHKRAYDLLVESADVAAQAARTTAGSRMVELADRYQEESRRHQIDELTRRNQQQTAELRQRTLLSRWLWTIVASMITVLAVTIWFLVRLRRSHRQLQAVNARRRQAEAEVLALNSTLEQQVRDRTAQLEAANRELESFSYSVSHDLRAPLRSLNGFSRVLLEDYEDRLDGSGRDHLRRIQAASQHMSHLIDGMLNLAQVSRVGLDRVPVDLTALASAVADTLRNGEPARHADVMIAPNLSATGDPRLLQVLLQNLLHNAWKFTSTRPAAHIELGQRLDNGMPVFYVRDDGVGFDMAYAHKLFGAFQRLHTTAEFPGTGIGLATVQRIVHRHGGDVWAESHVDLGTTFYFTLPDDAAASSQLVDESGREGVADRQ